MDDYFQCHSERQERALLTEKPILLLATGTQFGKTLCGALRMKIRTTRHAAPGDNFLITSPTYKILHQSTLPAFFKYMDGCGKYDKKFDTFKLNSGGTIYCRTETDPDSIVGITNIKHIWGDEAGKYGLYFWENIQARADFCGASIDLTTSPYSMNWIPKELIRPHEKGLRQDIEYITAASWENPYHSLHDPEKRKAKRATMDERRFDMIYGGQFGKMAGLVYDCFDEEAMQCEPFALPAGTKYYAGLDWGFSPDPFVIIIRAITPSGHHFQVSEFCKTRLTISDQVQAAKQKQQIFNIEKFFADPSQPGSIEEFNRNKLPTIPAENSIRDGIDSHYELIKSGKFKIFRGSSPYSIDEYASYHYPEPSDLGPDDDAKEVVPVDQGNHCMDAAKYLTMMTVGRGVNKLVPKMPEDKRPEIMRDNLKRLKYLKSGRKQYPGSEMF